MVLWSADQELSALRRRHFISIHPVLTHPRTHFPATLNRTLHPVPASTPTVSSHPNPYTPTPPNQTLSSSGRPPIPVAPSRQRTPSPLTALSITRSQPPGSTQCPSTTVHPSLHQTHPDSRPPPAHPSKPHPATHTHINSMPTIT
ncbi:hypothetical protein T492DRAFT_196192 [Pavlovales sp. CCMP2436]|nr:hypothetical protein T492DRAFT_196192 [Pavlovales sp. CCMP2436]